ncbi:MAG: hypothetical protein U0893_23855 [Chloroflexota bacterium]
MTGQGLMPFVLFFPEQALKETRVISTSRYPGLPDDDYGFQDSYCDNPTCHCRPVMLNAVNRSRGDTLASISFGFDPSDDLAGPFLDPLNPQSEYAEILLALARQLLQNPEYVDRLKAHYYQVKGATADPTFRRPPVPATRLTRAPAQQPRRPGGSARRPKKRR